MSRGRWIACHACAAIVGCLIAAIVAAAMDHRPVHKVISMKVVEPAYAGGTATVEWNVIAMRRCDGLVMRVVSVDGFDYQQSTWDLTAVVGPTPLGQPLHFRRNVQMPNVPGNAVMRTYIQRWCNIVQYWLPFARITEINTLPPFTLLPSPTR
jgi:hypothetical protein